MPKKPYHAQAWRKRTGSAQPPLEPEPSRTTRRNPPPDMTGLPLDMRMRIADGYTAAHPGRPVSAMLLELFPELRQIPNEP